MKGLFGRSLLYCLYLSATTCTQEAFAQDFSGTIEASLQEPTFQGGVLHTDKGGVIQAHDLRVQARSITYTNKTEDGRKVITLQASGDLLFEYGDKVFVGSSLTYDFMSGTGTLFNGRTAEGIWFVGGERIDLEGGGRYTLYGAYLTPSESIYPSFNLSADQLDIQGTDAKTSALKFTFC